MLKFIVGNENYFKNLIGSCFVLIGVDFDLIESFSHCVKPEKR